MLWRYWAVMNPHLLVLATCNGKPAAIEKQRNPSTASSPQIQLPKHDILIGRRFTETVVSLARSWFPETAVVVIDDAHLQFGSQNVSLVNLHRRYLASPDELPTQVRAFFIAVQGDLPASGIAGAWAHARERIMPVFTAPPSTTPTAASSTKNGSTTSLSPTSSPTTPTPPRRTRHHPR